MPGASIFWRCGNDDALSEKHLDRADGGHSIHNGQVIHWPVVLDQIVRDRLVEQVAVQRARVQLVTGPAGIGKSTLAASVSAQLQQLGFEVLPVVGMPELQDISLGAMAPLLASADAPAFESTGDRLQRLFSLVSRASAQYVLVVDDGPMLDIVSASTVYQLVRVYGMRCVMTARSEHPIEGPLLRLREEGFLEETELSGLSWTVAAGIVQRALDGTVEPDSLRAVIALADGNPLFLRGLVLAAQQADAVTQGRTGMVVDTARLPRRLWDTVALRFNGLRVEDRALADLIAIAEPWPEQLLNAPQALERLEQAALLARTPDGEIYLAHPLFAETIIGVMTEEVRDRWRIDAARRLLTTDREDLRFKAICLLAESTQPPAPGELTWAATAAHTVDDHTLAIRLASRAIERAAESDEDAPFQAHLVFANALSASGQLDAADAAFTVASGFATDDSERSTIATRQGFHLAVRRQRAPEAVSLGQAALTAISPGRARAFLAANISKWQLMTGELPTEPTALSLTGETAEAERSDAASDDDEPDAATALNECLYRLSAAVFAGDLTTVRSLIAIARPLTAAAHQVIRHGSEMVDFAEFVALVFDGRADDAIAFGERKRGEMIDEAAGMWSYGLALTAIHAGHVPDGLNLATASVEFLAWRDFLGILGTASALRATAAAQLGQTLRAEESLAAIEPSARSYISVWLQAAEAEAWLAWRRGDESGAIDLIVAAVDAGIAARHFAFASLTAHLAVRMGHAGAVLNVLRECAKVASGELVAAILCHAEAAAAGDVTGLLIAADRLARAGHQVGAAEAARQSAMLARAEGDDRSARRASTLAGQFSAGRFGLVGRKDSTAASGLSPREWEIASAAAQRERNREIAGRLGLSPRTIENHLRNIFRKLGVSSRDELARELAALNRPIA